MFTIKFHWRFCNKFLDVETYLFYRERSLFIYLGDIVEGTITL